MTINKVRIIIFVIISITLIINGVLFVYEFTKPIKTEQIETSVDDTLINNTIILDNKRRVKLTNNYWDVNEHNLTYTGVVVGGDRIENNGVYTNWLSVRNDSGEIHIIRNIDKDVWDAIQIGDIIR